MPELISQHREAVTYGFAILSYACLGLLYKPLLNWVIGPMWIVATIVLATIARFALAGGLLFGPSLNRANPARYFGALFTYICGLALAAGLLVT